MSSVRRSGIGLVAVVLFLASLAAISPAATASSGGSIDGVAERFSGYENLAWDHEQCPGGPGVDASPVAYVRNNLVGVDLTVADITQAAADLISLTGAPVTLHSFDYGVTAFELGPGVDAAQVLSASGANLPALHLNHVFSYDPFWRFSPYEQPTAVTGDEPQAWQDPLHQVRRVVVLDTGYPNDGGAGDYQLGDDTSIDVDLSQPTANHGPFIASQIARITPGEIVLQRVLAEEGLLTPAPSTAAEELFDELALIRTLGASDLRDAVVNMSFGTYGCEAGGLPRAIEKAIMTEIADGAHFVAAAGNDETNAQRFPAAFADTMTGVTAVGAHDGHANTPERACFSNFGSITTWAPGVDVIGQLPDGNWAQGSGTSFAAPHVTAALSAGHDVHTHSVGLRAIVSDDSGEASSVGTAC